MSTTQAISVLQAAPALSVRQPWAELIARGVKTVEIRNWDTPYRGPLWIHAALKPVEEATRERLGGNLFYGGVVALATLEAIVPLTAERWEKWHEDHCDRGPFQSGMFAWCLCDVVRLKRGVPTPGRLKLFHLPGEVTEAAVEETPKLLQVPLDTSSGW